MRVYRVVATGGVFALVAAIAAGYLFQRPFASGALLYVAPLLVIPGQLFVILMANDQTRGSGKRSRAFDFGWLPGGMVAVTAVSTALVGSLVLLVVNSPLLSLGSSSPQPECPTGLRNKGTFTCATAQQFLQVQLAEQTMFLGAAAYLLFFQAVILTNVLRGVEGERTNPTDSR